MAEEPVNTMKRIEECFTQQDFDDFVNEFGSSFIRPELLERMEEITGHKPHKFLRRGLFYSHRDLEQLLDAYQEGKRIYIYTGRGPSSDSLHLGHMIPFIFTQYLQKIFNAICVIQITDDEKFLRDINLTQEQTFNYAIENIKDIIACGYDPEKTFIFIDSLYIQHLYPVSCKVGRLISVNEISKVFGFSDKTNVSYFAFPPTQIAPSFPDAFPHIFGGMNPKDVYCLIPQGIEQDPYFRLCRDVAEKLGYNKPSLIHAKYIPSLYGIGKMSASQKKEDIQKKQEDQFRKELKELDDKPSLDEKDQKRKNRLIGYLQPSKSKDRQKLAEQAKSDEEFNSTIFMTDTPDQINNKISKYAYSGGQETIDKQRELGADLDRDVSIKYLEVFLDDDDELEKIKESYKSGKMLTGDVKKIFIELVQDIVKTHQERRSEITQEKLNTFISVRPMKMD